MSNESGSRKSRNSRWKARKCRRKQTARSKNTKVLRVQSTLAGENLVAKDSDAFGHEFPLQPTINSSIITFQNTGQMKQFIMSSKSEQIAKAFKKSNASVALYAEHSLNQKSKQIPTTERFHQRMINVNPSSLSKISFNVHANDDTPWNYPGGTALTVDRISRGHHASNGVDSSGLGRWTWIRLEGKLNTFASYIAAYRPCHNDKDVASTWNQHVRYFSDQGIQSPNPRDIFDDDLIALLRIMLQNGDNVILGIDMNEDVRTGKLAKRLKELGLIDLILSTHPTLSPPATFNRNTTRTPVDAIWGNTSLDIISAGYGPFDGGYPSALSDGHRLLWIMASNQSLLGKHLPITNPKLRIERLKSHDPRSRKIFTRRVRKEYCKQDVFRKKASLAEKARWFWKGTAGITNEAFLKTFKPKIDALHTTTRNIKLKVAADLRKIYAGGQDFSPKAQAFRDTIEFWRRIVKRKQGVLTSRTALRLIAKRVDISLKLPKSMTLEQADEKLTLAYRAYFKAKPEFPTWREEFQIGLIEAIAEDTGTTVKQIKARMKREKHQRVMGNNAKCIRQKNASDPILRATATNDNGEIFECENEEEMVSYMAKSNLSRQQQSVETPFMTPPLVDIFGYLAKDEVAQSVINGTFIAPADTNKYVLEFLDTLVMPEGIRELGPVKLKINCEENRTGWAKMKARTSSEPTCPSFGSCKTSSMDQELNRIDTFLRDTATLLGIDFTSWKIITDFQILKRKGEFHVDTMRCIQLMDAEFNMMNKHVGRCTLAHAEQAKAVAPDQYGSRKNHDSRKAVLNKVLLNDLARQKRIAIAIGMNDARGCYDRIVHTIAILVLMSFGVPGETARGMFKVLQEAEHHMKTGFGRSDRAYGNEPVPQQGSGQGNGIGPTLWVLISTKLIMMMYRKRHGVEFLSATTLTLFTLVCFAFVDDTDLPLTRGKYSTGEELINPFQEALDRWAGGLTVTGGELAPIKSWCYLVDHIWTGKKWRYRTKEEMPGEFTLTDRHGVRHAIDRLEPSVEKETLGILIAPDGNQKELAKCLKEKAKDFGEKIRSSQCTADTAMYTYNSCFMKSIEYSWIVTNFDSRQWNEILAPALERSLNKSAMARKFPRGVLYGPELYEGLNIKHPYYSQGITKLMACVQECAIKSQQGALLQHSAEDFMLELGYPMTLGTFNWKVAMEYLTPCWYGHLAKFVSSQVLDVKGTFSQLQLLRQSDRFIMLDFIKQGYRKAELAILNHMRMSIKAISLADIVTSNGFKISQNAFLHLSSNGLREEGFNWPNAPPKFTKKQVEFWQEALRRTFCISHPIQSERRLKPSCRLQSWTKSDILKKWTTFYSFDEDRIYKKAGLSWQAYSASGRGGTRARKYTKIEQPYRELPTSANELASICPRNTMLSVECYTPWILSDLDNDPLSDDPTIGPFISLEDAFETSVDSKKILLDKFKLPADNCKLIASGIEAGTARAVCDGSFDPKDSLGTAAFVMVANKKDSNGLTGANWSPGTKEDQTPYRSELTGVDSILAVLAILVRHYNIKKGAITIAFDCETALKTCSKSDPLSIKMKCFDILQDIRNRLEILPIEVSWRWVEGHQKEKGKRMDWWARQNFGVDLAAKAYLRECRRAKRPFKPIQLKYEHWAVYCKNIKQSNIHQEKLYEQIFHTETMNYWNSHHCIPVPSQCNIHREANRMARKKLTPAKRRFVAKFCTSCIGVGHTLKYRQWQNHARCPCCGHENEKADHVLLCPDRRTKRNFKKAVKKILEPILEETKTEPTLSSTILEIIFHWRNKQTITHTKYSTLFGIRAAVKEQNDGLGWTNFVLGRWSPKWQQVQQQYLTSIKSRKSSLRWAAAVINKLLMTVWNVWDFRNNINKGKNGPEYLQKKTDLCRTINTEYTLGITNLPKKAHHLIYSYFKKTLFEMKFGRQRDWIKQIQLARKEFVDGIQPVSEPQPRSNNLREWLIIGQRDIAENSDEDDDVGNYDDNENTNVYQTDYVIHDRTSEEEEDMANASDAMQRLNDHQRRSYHEVHNDNNNIDNNDDNDDNNRSSVYQGEMMEYVPGGRLMNYGYTTDSEDSL